MAEPAAIRRCRPLLGTFVEIAAPKGFEAAVSAAFDAVAHIHARMSFHEEGSDLATLRRAPPGTAVAVDRDTVAVIRFARTLFHKTDGLFDIAIGAELVHQGFLPVPSAVDPADMTGTAGDIEVLGDSHICCREPMLIDLGGIAKGYAVDRAVEVLEAAGATSGIVNAGGDLRVIGAQPQHVHLRRSDGTVGGSLEIAGAAIATSSNLHACRTFNGATVAPHLGRGRAAIIADRAVSVIAASCMTADAMTKIALADQALAESLLVEQGGGEILWQDMLELVA